MVASLGALCSVGGRFKALSPVVVSAGQLTGTTGLVLPLALLWEMPWTLHPTLGMWAAMLGLALLSTAAASLIFFRILALSGVTNVMLVNFLVPVSALLLGRFALGERLDGTVFAGMALIFAGLLTLDGRVPAYGARFVGRIHSQRRS